MKVYEITLTKQQLLSLPEKERPLFFQLGHVFNEISFLNKLLIMVSHTEAAGLERKGMTVQSMIVARIFIGKAFEAWRMLEKELLKTKLMLDLDQHLPDEAKQALQYLKRYFGGTSLLATIRNKFSFHYLSEHIDEVMSAVPDEKEFKLVLGDSHANTLHDFAEEVVSFGMLQKTHAESAQGAMNNIIGDLAEISGNLLSFIGHLSAAMFHERLGRSWDAFAWKEYDIDPPKSLESFKIPFFLAVNDKVEP